MDARPIGLFDSGIGGLTVLRTLMNLHPKESFVYLGDTARLPYGSKSPSTIERYLGQNIRFLETQNVKAIVVACNSASTVLLNRPNTFAIPVYNVIEPGATAAVRASTSKRIGVLGTKATVTAEAYPRTLKSLDPSVQTFQQACAMLVPLVEEGWEDDPLTNLVVYRYVNPILQMDIDTLILGCTHYPVLRGSIGRVVGPHVTLIDGAEAVSHVIADDFKFDRLRASAARIHPLRILTTDVSPTFNQIAARLMRPHAIGALEAIDLSETT